MRVTIGKIGNYKYMCKLEYVVPLKRDTKKTLFCISSDNFFLKYGLQYNHWVGHSVKITVDTVEFKKRKALWEGKNGESDNFDMEILDEGALDKALEGSEKL